jgi:hypothetical protein
MSKEQKQKIMLGALLAIALIYIYFEFGLGPLSTKRKAAEREIATLTPKILDADKKIKVRDTLKAQIPAAEEFLVQIDKMIPEGAPVAWFPTMIGEHFKAGGGERVTTRMVAEVADPAVEGYKRISWTVEIPKVDIIEFGPMLANFENQQPLVDCSSMIIEFEKDEPQHQRISLNLNNSIKK